MNGLVPHFTVKHVADAIGGVVGRAEEARQQFPEFAHSHEGLRNRLHLRDRQGEGDSPKGARRGLGGLHLSSPFRCRRFDEVTIS